MKDFLNRKHSVSRLRYFGIMTHYRCIVDLETAEPMALVIEFATSESATAALNFRAKGCRTCIVNEKSPWFVVPALGGGQENSKPKDCTLGPPRPPIFAAMNEKLAAADDFMHYFEQEHPAEFKSLAASGLDEDGIGERKAFSLVDGADEMEKYWVERATRVEAQYVEE
ncbi:hypothetical protein BOTBODRAFT_181225 [Botryobasidium botryosum FD-172 SS1]|uniref:Uncharacterized protein n=1 Tax=Botryobasidium botryosum (strain FD-172 SS1) TaxID=930990 RepID=A0A067LUQ7_BOTB1|nr:hypothetical protein BOTBODRAFT_181225 [Botryobasidium botryosum FD-172 SS1]